MRIGGVFFEKAEGGVARRAARFDHVVLYGDPVLLRDRLDAYHALGVDAHLLPVTVSDAPSLPELLAHIGLLRRLSRRGGVLVEGHGVEGLVAAALLIAEGVGGVGRVIGYLARHGYSAAYNPLQLRLLALLDYLAEWMDVRREADEARGGGFWEADLAVENAYMIGGFMPLSPARVYRAALGAGNPRSDVERLAVEADRILAPRVRVVAVEAGYEELTVRLGCIDPGGCLGAAGAAEKLYGKLARWLSLRGVRVVVENPAEAACRAYGYLDREMCGGPGRDG